MVPGSCGKMKDLDKFNYECEEQICMFDLIRVPIKVTKTIRLIELFAGYGSQAMALKRIGAKFEHYRVVEFDKYAIASYNAVHGTDFPPMDITKVHAEDLNICDTEKYCYFMTYSFPCTDLSVAGKQAGMKKGSGTRSGLLWEVERILREIKESGGELPQILFMENVPQVHADANMADFQKWIDFLSGLGYANYWQDLNAKDYGVAQNRNRCFMFSFLGEYNYHFPRPTPLTKRIRDYLEESVDSRFYVSDKALKGFAEHAKKQKEKGNSFHAVCRDTSDIAATIKSRYYKDGSDCLIRSNVVGQINSSQDGKVVDSDGIALTQMDGHYNTMKIIEPTIVAMRGRNPENPSDRTTGAPTEQRLEPNTQGLCNCLTSVQKDNLVMEESIIQRARGFNKGGQYEICPPVTAHSFQENNLLKCQYRIRKLTPRECGRLMGVSDEDISKMAEVNSNTQLYKQFGNSIVVDIMCKMFSNLDIDQ